MKHIFFKKERRNSSLICNINDDFFQINFNCKNKDSNLFTIIRKKDFEKIIKAFKEDNLENEKVSLDSLINSKETKVIMTFYSFMKTPVKDKYGVGISILFKNNDFQLENKFFLENEEFELLTYLYGCMSSKVEINIKKIQNENKIFLDQKIDEFYNQKKIGEIKKQPS